MKLDDLSALLATTLDKPISNFNELKRTLRQQSPDFARLDSTLDAETLEHRETSPEEIDFRGRPGPGGGVDVDPFLAAFFTLASVIDAPRAQASSETWAAWHFRSYFGFGSFLNECPLTQKPLFGEALKAIVSDPALAERVGEIQISVRGNWAEIHFDHDDEGGQSSRFAKSQDRKNNLYTVVHLDGAVVQAVAAFLERAKAHP